MRHLLHRLVDPDLRREGPGERRTLDEALGVGGIGASEHVGAGRGYFLEALRDRGIEGIGVDIAVEAASEARRIGLEIVVEDASEFLSQRTGFAGVFISHLVEHLAPTRVDELLQVARKSVRPGGSIVIVTPNPGDWMVLSRIFWLDPTHLRPYPQELIAAMLESAGFEVEATGLRSLPLGRRQIPSTFLNRIRLGNEYGRGEAWVRARRIS